MSVHPRGYWVRKQEPKSARQKEDQRLVGLTRQSWLESGAVYGYRKITRDLRYLGKRCRKHRVYRLMLQKGLREQVGYRRRLGRLAAGLNGIERPLAGILIALMDIAVLPLTRIACCLLGQFVQVFSAKKIP